MTYDLIVIGAGIAGLTAANEAAKCGLQVCLLERLMFGGLVLNVNHLDPKPPSLPGSGSDAASELMMTASDLGVTTVFSAATALMTDGGLSVVTDAGPQIAHAVIIATGAHHRKLGVRGEVEFENRGVSHCADCDAPMYRGQDVVVVGGGDSALQEALVLAEFCGQVHLVHRGKAFSARNEFVDKLRQCANIRQHLDTVVEALLGKAALERVAVRGPNKAAREISCTGFFAYVGLDPNSEFISTQMERDENGCIKVDGRLRTSVPDVYAIGAVRAGYGGELREAQEDARMAVSVIARRMSAAG